MIGRLLNYWLSIAVGRELKLIPKCLQTSRKYPWALPSPRRSGWNDNSGQTYDQFLPTPREMLG